MWQTRLSLGSLLALVLASTAASGQGLTQSIFVDQNSAGLVQDGTTWCSAYLTLEDGLAAASSGDVVYVADGIYVPDTTGLSDPREATFLLPDGVTIEGSYAGCGAVNPNARDLGLYRTTLRGEIQNDGDTTNNVYHVVTASGLLGTTTVDLLAVESGFADGSVTDGTVGAGMLIVNCPTIVVTGVDFEGNEAKSGPADDVGRGGAVYMRDSKATFVDTIFREGTGGEAAGGLYLEASTAIIEDSAFAINVTKVQGGDLFVDEDSLADIRDTQFVGGTASHDSLNLGSGGAIYNESDDLLVVDCTFFGIAKVDGGAVYNEDEAHFVNCEFGACRADDDGAAIYNDTAIMTLSNCLFSNGIALDRGGAIYCDSGKLRAGNCTIVDNTAAVGAAGVDLVGTGGGTALDNCILWGNRVGGVADELAQVRHDVTTPLDVNTSDVEGLTGSLGGVGNIGLDPQFVNPGVGDYHLGALSPCLDAGANSRILRDRAGLDGDADFREKTPFDLDGNARIVSTTVDMGAFELP